MNRTAYHLPRCITALLAAFALLVVLPAPAATEDARVFELRVYTCNDDKLPNLLARFRDHTCALFEKHGIQNIGYWVPVDKENGADTTLIYIVAHKTREGAKASWAAFSKDPEWQKVAKESEANGKLLAKKPESTYMTATDYSAAIKAEAGAADRVFELRTYTCNEGKLPVLQSRFRDHTVALFEKHGMTNIGYWNPTDPETGAGKKLIYILAHASKEAGMKSFDDFRADPEWVKAKAESEKDGPLTIKPDGVKSVYMKPTDFSPIK
ncbi:MAG: hypothetical protein JWO94_532 [Verrucomicrobiaceae bacterium]|nr:hypothetical protein [Verrucomicrobiaceae bacterium]